MSRHAQVISVASAVCAALFAFAFVAAPQSCEWGLAAYFWAGVATLVILPVVPAALLTDRSVPKRALLGLGLAAIVLAVWVAGLFMANVRIMCRLF